MGHCELEVAVDCSSISPDSPASPALLAMVGEVLAGNSSASPDHSLMVDSLLAYMEQGAGGRNFTQDQLLEAFCR